MRGNEGNKYKKITDEWEDDNETVDESLESNDVTWKPRVILICMIIVVGVKINIVQVSKIVNECKRIMKQVKFFGQCWWVWHF